MANSGAGDKISSLIIPNCHRTASGEVKLQSCGFSSGLKVLLDDIQPSSPPENVAGIPIVTLPDSSDEYHTPPEHHSHTIDRNDGDQLDVDSCNESAHQVFDKMPQRERETTNIEKRKLPVSINTQGQKSNCCKDITFRDALNRVTKMVGEGKGKRQRHGGGEDGDVDFLEITKMRGMTFPRPRWRPSEGFKD